jgi:uncharacterized membrane protein YedE/YeeE
MRTPKPYMNPYLAGIGLGLVLLAAFVIMGRGLGAQSNAFYKGYLNTPNGNPLNDWIVYEIVGVLIGGAISGFLSGRIRRTVDKGKRISVTTRMIYALVGGMLIGFGSKIARGCTSGQALTGGALLSVGSWIFMLAVFAAAYTTAYLFRKQWT